VTTIDPFESLVTRHQGEIYAYILRMVRNDGEAQDICQETFLRAYRAYEGLDGSPNYRAWLYKIATNTTLNSIRQRRNGEKAVTTLATTQPVEVHENHVERIGHQDLLDRVEEAIQLLPLKQRLAFTQRRFLGLTYEEIATALECSEEAARANVYQAARKLRIQFATDLTEVGI